MPLLPTTSAAEEIARLFRENPNVDREIFTGLVTEHFRKKYESQDAFNQIPVLGLERPPESFADGALVVFHGMIQDTSLSSELYLAKGTADQVGGWGLPAIQDENTSLPTEDLRECSVFWAVSIPGLSSWTNDGQVKSNEKVTSPLPAKYPGSDPHVGIQIKIYDEALTSPVRATNIYTFIGLLGTDPFHANQDSDAEVLDVPTLHVLTSKALPTTIVPRSFPKDSIKSTVQNLRGELIQWTATEALDGDLVAAEWILLALLARVQLRTPAVIPPSITISNFPPPPNPGALPTLQHVLELIFPLVSTMPLSLNTLNQTSFCPESKEEDLHSGWLQIPKGSILILNEGVVTEGSISSKGVSNIQAIQETMNTQTVEYIFPFSNYRFETDINFVVLTEGKKSTFFETALKVPLHRSRPLPETQSSLYKPADQMKLPPERSLELYRQLIGGARVGSVVIGDATSKHVEQEFVDERAAGSFTSDDLIQRILTAKTVALSFHDTDLTIAHWDHAKALESKIKSRQ